MAIEDPELWARLTAWDFPLSGRGKTLVERLAESTALSSAQAEDAVAEYRRYLYLAATQGGQLVPPPVVERCLQEHRSGGSAFQSEFVSKVLGRQPSFGMPKNKKDRAAAYARTLAVYREVFGEAPHRNIWPSPEMLRYEVWLAFPFMLGFLFAFMSFASGAVLWGLFWLVFAVSAFVMFRRAGPWPLEKAKSNYIGD